MISGLTTFRSSVAETGGLGWDRVGLDFMLVTRANGAGETGGPVKSGLPLNFCDRRESNLSAHRPRAVASPRTHAVTFHRQCVGHWGKQPKSSTRNMSPTISPLPAIVFRSPTITVSTICAALERSVDDVMRLIWDGSLRFAWNIALDGQTRQEIRVLS